MGVMSRRVVPVCGNLCFCCPSLRPRSRQPVKRYKKMLAEIFPRNQDAEPNDRKIGKLCAYASKNPLRIPKISEYLEQRCYKDLRNENFGSVRVVLCIYRKLLSSCKEHLSLFASSLLEIVHTLLEETRQYELQILVCITLVDFMNSQADSTFLFNLEGLIPKLCQVASETGGDDRALSLRSAGMQALACMVLFMGDHSQISMDFGKIISVMLENYTFLQPNLESKQATSLPNVLANADVEPPTDAVKNPSYWSRICLRNMARLAKEAATARRVLEPLFQSFDAENHWAIGEGLGCSVLMYLQSLLEESESSSDLLFSVLVKHLDHKNVAGKPQLQIDIIKVTTVLARNAKRRSSVTVIGTITELIMQLRRCVQRLAEGSTAEGVIDKKKADLQSSLENCILELSSMVGDIGPILDVMAVVLESLPVTAINARSTVFAVYRTANMISSIPNLSYDKKAFPDGLFHQLILAMAHPDCETRVGAHCVLSTVLMPPSLSQKLKPGESLPSDMDVQMEEINYADIDGQPHCFKFTFHNERTEMSSLRLSSHQVSLLLSSIWVQATFSENRLANFEAMAHTYSMALLFARSKTSNHTALARCFQLALSLRSISLEAEGYLQPSRRRSLFTLASYMLIISAKAENLSELIPHVKASLTDETIDPYLELIEDTRLRAVCIETNAEAIPYGSEEDEAAALKSLSAIVSNDQNLKETILSHLVTKSATLSEDELSTFKEQFQQDFSPDEAYPLGVPSFMEAPRPHYPLGNVDLHNLDQVTPPDSATDDEGFPELSESQSDRKSSLSPYPVDVLNVNQLMESVMETAQQVASFPISSTPVSYDQMKNQCEALVSEKQQKMSVLQSFKNPEEDSMEESTSPGSKMEFSEEDLKLVTIESALVCSHGQNLFSLPPSSPYDKFRKAAGC